MTLAEVPRGSSSSDNRAFRGPGFQTTPSFCAIQISDLPVGHRNRNAIENGFEVPYSVYHEELERYSAVAGHQNPHPHSNLGSKDLSTTAVSSETLPRFRSSTQKMNSGRKGGGKV